MRIFAVLMVASEGMECVARRTGQTQNVVTAAATSTGPSRYAKSTVRQGGGNAPDNPFGIAIALPRFRIAWSPYISPFRMHALYQAR